MQVSKQPSQCSPESSSGKLVPRKEYWIVVWLNPCCGMWYHYSVYINPRQAVPMLLPGATELKEHICCENMYNLILW